ncbi:MAG: 30S ribosomal protein S12 methylthiotransferase RimO [Candidatus Omnitrophota bacterium]
MKIGLVSLGCARTLVDSEAALGGLKNEGYEIVRDVRRADVAIVNTCGFIEEAKRESIETILELCALKKKGRLSAVVVLGCLAQRFGPEIREEISEVDGIVGTDNYGDLAAVLAPLRDKKKVFEVKAKPRYLVDENTPRYSLTPAHTAYVKISEGCINACSYCVIPKMKGPHRSRTVESVVNEIRKLVQERRLSEVNLIGQDTAAFGFDRDRTFQLPALLSQAAKLGVPWVRLLYAHPGHVSQEMIDVMADSPAICKYVDFPIEHSHDAMLVRMNRGVTREKMEWGMRTLRKKMPAVTMRTTVIVGFPGETEEEFRDLMEFLKEARFERLGAFIFSPEEGSRAFGMPGHVPQAVKEERFRAVMEQQREISRELNGALIGKTVRVLVDEKVSKEAGVFCGRTEGDAPEVDQEVEIHSRAWLRPGEFVDVKITDALEYDLVGSYEPA